MSQKILIGVMCICLCIIGFVVYSFYAPMSIAGNKTYSDEYYYNETYTKESDMPNQEPLYDTLKDDMPDSVSGTGLNIPAGLAKNKERDMTDVDGYKVLINRDYPLPSDYIPQDLEVPDILFTLDHYTDKKLMRSKAARALEKMFAASEAEGLSVTGISGYRSYERQETVYRQSLEKSGNEHTRLYSALPGTSEHQSGLSIDVGCPSNNYRLEADFADTEEGKWLAENSWKYGIIIRYPEGKSEITGYEYEPWHLRYVGKKLAAYLYKNNLTLEEYYGYIPSEAEKDDYGNSIDVEEPVMDEN